jgi:hypothetical protein
VGHWHFSFSWCRSIHAHSNCQERHGNLRHLHPRRDLRP